MANNEEPIRSALENMSVSTQGEVLPEMAAVPVPRMPRSLMVSSIINQWQPMGIRIVVNLPYVGNDDDFLFVIRNGPFIPMPPKMHAYKDMAYSTDAELYQEKLEDYAANNMAAVKLFSNKFEEYPDYDDAEKDFPITLTQYDLPPPIAAFAMSFRRWRGMMQYRIRVVSGSITQGYIIITPIKNVFIPIGIYNQYKFKPAITRQDRSYRSSMLNSYGLVDAALFRHSEISMPFDYPVAYYDQFAWMARRAVSGPYFLPYDGTGAPPVKPVQSSAILGEPHGDNLIAVGIRGELATSLTGSQINFELEYRCAEDFQFADPFLPCQVMCKSTEAALAAEAIPYRIPHRDLVSNGLGPEAEAKKSSSNGAAGVMGTSSRNS